jgi:type IV secretory pathway VirB3-like protein
MFKGITAAGRPAMLIAVRCWAFRLSLFAVAMIGIIWESGRSGFICVVVVLQPKKIYSADEMYQRQRQS